MQTASNYGEIKQIMTVGVRKRETEEKTKRERKKDRQTNRQKDRQGDFSSSKISL